MNRAAYMREYRRRNHDAAQRNRLLNRAVGRAHRRLAQAHRDEFAALLAEERAAVGLPPQGTTERNWSPTSYPTSIAGEAL